MKKLVFAVCAALVACSSGASSTSGTNVDVQPAGPYIAGFNPAPVKDGYQRFVLPPIRDIAPGTDKMWCQYISPPFEKDTDLVMLAGEQSKGGHHIILYATSAPIAPGTTRDCSDKDMSAVRFLGGIGGESASAVTKLLPAGTVFRIPKGFSLFGNVHYINAGSKPIDAQGVIDISLAPPDPSKQVVSLFTNVSVGFTVPASRASSFEVSCTMKKDIDILFFGNHMHELGARAHTEVLRGGKDDASKEMLREDKTWNEQMVFNPTFDEWKMDAPMKLRAGDVVRTHCEWTNTKPADVLFPTEMCVGFGMYLGTEEIDCVDNAWPTGQGG